MAMISEGKSRTEWRAQVLEYVVSRATETGRVRFVSESGDGRREMERLVRRLPDGFDAEIYKDGPMTYLVVSTRVALPDPEPMFVVHYPDTATG